MEGCPFLFLAITDNEKVDGSIQRHEDSSNRMHQCIVFVCISFEDLMIDQDQKRLDQGTHQHGNYADKRNPSPPKIPVTKLLTIGITSIQMPGLRISFSLKCKVPHNSPWK